MKMLGTLYDDVNHRVLVKGFYDNIEPISATNDAKLRAAAKNYDLKVAAQNLGVGRFISDDPYEVLKMSSYGTSFNLDGIWGGNMFAGSSGAILPNKITSKHNIRYVPNMTGPDIVAKIRKASRRARLQGCADQSGGRCALGQDHHRYGDRPLGKRYVRYVQHPARAAEPGRDHHGRLLARLSVLRLCGQCSDLRRHGGHGRKRARGGTKYYVIEGAGKVYGIAGAEKSVATALYNYAGQNGPIPISAAKK